MKLISKEHVALNQQLQALERVITVLEYPPDLMHEVRRGWPEIQLSLRGIHYYFADLLPRHFEQEEKALFDRLAQKTRSQEAVRLLNDLRNEHTGLRTLLDSMTRLIKGWSQSPALPPTSDTQLLAGLKNELRIHMQRHERLEDRILPLAEKLLGQDEFQTIMRELGYAEAEEETAAPEKRTA